MKGDTGEAGRTASYAGRQARYRDKAVTAEVEGLLGLNREQFSQIAMLAQGSFSRLLSGRTEDRGIIFREIFKTKPLPVVSRKS